MKTKPLKILFVEDNPEDVELAILRLTKDGFDVSWKRVDTEPAMRDTIKAWVPDIILSDYSMPAFNGLDSLKLARELVPDIPFVFLSGTIGEERAIEAIHEGATDYILKDNTRKLGTSISRIMQDQAIRKHARKVEEEKSRLADILESTSDLVAIVNLDGSLLFLNKGGKELLNIDSTSSLNIQGLHADWVWSHIQDEIFSTIKSKGIWKGEAVLLSSDGKEIPVSELVISHTNQSGEVDYYSYIARDIRDKKAYEEKIQHMANFDSLTNLPNRNLMADRVHQAISHYRTAKKSLAILVIDICRFKTINDGYGRKIGDQLLEHFSKRLKSSLRDTHTVARMSADTFAVMVTQIQSPDDIITMVQRIRKKLTEPFSIAGKTINISTMIGVSTFPKDGEDFHTLLENADAAMHRAKELGDTEFQFYTSDMTKAAAEHIRLESDLRSAILSNELELYYQPQFYLQDLSIVGVEALIRWNHPRLGTLNPERFIPLAENTGLIFSIGNWVIEAACEQLNSWDGMGYINLRMSINVSAIQFRHPRFVDILKKIIQSCSISANRIELEITESALIMDPDEAVHILNRLNSLGVKISLDDFGTGYSSLKYLAKLPIDCLKIDKSFVSQASSDTNSLEIVKAIISMATALGLNVIAEGIETQQQLKLLRSFNCPQGQGWLISKPLPSREISNFLHQCSQKRNSAKSTSPAQFTHRG